MRSAPSPPPPPPPPGSTYVKKREEAGTWVGRSGRGPFPTPTTIQVCSRARRRGVLVVVYLFLTYTKRELLLQALHQARAGWGVPVNRRSLCYTPLLLHFMIYMRGYLLALQR